MVYHLMFYRIIHINKYLKRVRFMHKLWLYVSIYLLTAADLIFTYAGLQQGAIEEANPLMNFFFSRWPLFTVLGVLLAAALILFFLYSVRERVKWLTQALTFIMVFKIFVILLHSYWIILI